MKIINIELPTCNRDNALFKYFLKNIHFLEPIKDYMDFSINFNGNITDKDIEACLSSLSSFDVYWAKNQYVFEKDKHDIIKIREDTHKLNPNFRPIVLIIDDDVEITNENYARELLMGAYYILNTPKVGIISINNIRKQKENLIHPLDMTFKYWTNGGILLRNIEEWNNLIPPECHSLYGSLDDVLDVYERLLYGYEGYGIYSTSFKHYEHRKEDGYIAGLYAHKWNFSTGKPGSSTEYLHNRGVGRGGKLPINIWASKLYWKEKSNFIDFSNLSLEEIKEKISQWKSYRICNLELPTCDKKSMKNRFFKQINYLRPIAKYCVFCINFQRDYEELDMQQIAHRLRTLGFEVRTTYSTYEHPQWNQFREDTHKLNPNCKMILSIDDDVIFKSEDISKDYLMAMYKLLTDDEAGVVAVETEWYHRCYCREENILFPARIDHNFSTDVGLFLKNIPDWNGIVKKELHSKTGTHHDVFVAFERINSGYKAYYINTKNAEYDKVKVSSNELYGIRKTVMDKNSIENHLRTYCYKNDVTTYDSSRWTKPKYWETEKGIDYSQLTIEQLYELIDKEL